MEKMTEASGDPRPVADDLLRAMASIRRALRRLADRPGVLAGLTSAQVELLHAVRLSPGISVAEAAEQLRLAPNTVSTLVGQLAATGLLVRGADPTDRRVARLDLEPRTRRRLTEWKDRRSDAVVLAMAALPEADRQVLSDAAGILARLADALDPMAGAGVQHEQQ
jgi:DNA-binding MarR family transcriptional regulator